MLFDFAALDPQRRYKVLSSVVVPRPIAWVTSTDIDGRLNAAPFSFFNALSGDPPVIGLGIGSREPGAIKDTGHNIRQTGQFVVNLVSAALAERMNVTAIEFPCGVDELRHAGLSTLPSSKIAAPRIAESPAALECERLAAVEVGNQRVIVLGRVLAIHVREDAVLDEAACAIDTPALDLIARMHGGGWYLRTTDLFGMPRIPLHAWTDETGGAARND